MSLILPKCVEFRKREALRQKQEQELLIIQMREEQRSRNMMYIIVGNIVVLILALAVWFVLRKIKMKSRCTGNAAKYAA